MFLYSTCQASHLWTLGGNEFRVRCEPGLTNLEVQPQTSSRTMRMTSAHARTPTSLLLWKHEDCTSFCFTSLSEKRWDMQLPFTGPNENFSPRENFGKSNCCFASQSAGEAASLSCDVQQQHCNTALWFHLCENRFLMHPIKMDAFLFNHQTLFLTKGPCVISTIQNHFVSQGHRAGEPGKFLENITDLCNRESAPH